MGVNSGWKNLQPTCAEGAANPDLKIYDMLQLKNINKEKSSFCHIVS